MAFATRQLCALFLSTACALGAGCSTTPPPAAPQDTPPPDSLFKNEFMNKAMAMIAAESILAPHENDLARIAIDGIQRALEPTEGLHTPTEIIAMIDDPATDPARYKKMVAIALQSVLESLSPHDRYVSEDEVTRSFAGFSRMRGIGVHLLGDRDSGGLMIEEVAEYGPAQRAGLQAGDIILAVDGQDINGDMAGGIGMILGEDGTPITLRIKRAGQTEAITVALKRGPFVFDPTPYRLIDDVAYIRLRDFHSTKAGERIESAIETMNAARQGQPMAGYILDLRGNTGGRVTEAHEIIDNFIDATNGISFSFKGRKISYEEKLTPGDILHGAPLVVLINDESASASELLAGAMQDHHRATIIGTRSFGKGTVQSKEYLRRFDNTRNDAVLITTGLYYLPSGASIQNIGIMPDIQVANVAPIRAEHERDYPGALPNPAPDQAYARQKPPAICTVDYNVRMGRVAPDLSDFRGKPDKALLCAYDHLRKASQYTQTTPAPKP